MTQLPPNDPPPSDAPVRPVKPAAQINPLIYATPRRRAVRSQFSYNGLLAVASAVYVLLTTVCIAMGHRSGAILEALGIWTLLSLGFLGFTAIARFRYEPVGSAWGILLALVLIFYGLAGLVIGICFVR